MSDPAKAQEKSARGVLNAVLQLWKEPPVIEFAVEMTASLFQEGFDKLCKKYGITGVVMAQQR